MKALAATPHLKRLDLHDSSIQDEDLRFLVGLTELEWLDLSTTQADTVHKPRITDAGLQHLATLPRLRTLNLYGLPITDVGLKHLKSLPTLERLQLGRTRVTGEGLRYLPNLKWIRLDATPITDDGLRHIQATVGLEQLYLDQTGVSDTGLRYLLGLKKLKALNVHDTKVTAAGVAMLRKALPGIAVGWGGNEADLNNALDAKADNSRNAPQHTRIDLPSAAGIAFGPDTNRPAPELQTTSQWKNSKPLTLAALRGKYVLLDFWGHWCAPCVRAIPSLMAIHEQFSDQGLVVLGIHDASVASIAEMDEKLIGIRRNLWMDHGINYAVAIDRPDSARSDAGNRRGTGATATAYGIELFPTLLLIDPAGKLVGKFHATTFEGKIAELERLLHVKATSPAWKTEFDQLYRLEKGNLLRCIREPFIPQRKEFFFYRYIRSGLMERAPASVTIEAPVSASFAWEAESQTIADVRPGPKTLLSLLGDFGFEEREIQGCAPLLERDLSSDWMFVRRFSGDLQRRADGERKALLAAFERILKDQLQLSVHFTPTIVERDAYRATGAWKLAPLGSEYSRSDVHLFTDKPDPPDSTSGGGGTGNLDDFLNYVGRLGMVSITNTTGRTDGGKFSWRQHNSAKQEVLKNSRGAFEQLLTRVSEQTGLRFEKIQQPERVWVVEERD